MKIIPRVETSVVVEAGAVVVAGPVVVGPVVTGPVVLPGGVVLLTDVVVSSHKQDTIFNTMQQLKVHPSTDQKNVCINTSNSNHHLPER